MKLRKSIKLFLEDVKMRTAVKTHTTYRDRLKGLVAKHGDDAVGKLIEFHQVRV